MNFERRLFYYFENLKHQLRTQPLILGGVSISGGGAGGPPGGFIGQLPQFKVTYDKLEAGTVYTPPSGISLLDNLNHIRYRLNTLEANGGGGTGALPAYTISGVSNPPLESEIINAFGQTADEFFQTTRIGIINDSGNSDNEYFVVSDNTNYWAVPLAKTISPNIVITVTSTKTLIAPTGSEWFGRSTMLNIDDIFIMAYREGRDHNINYEGQIHLKFSDDYGDTWSDEDKYLDGTAITGFPMYPPNAPPTSARGPIEGLLHETPNGNLLCTMWDSDYYTVGNGTWQGVSTDKGKTWSTPTKIDYLGITGDDYLYGTDDYFVYDGIIYAVIRQYDGAPESNKKALFVKSTDNGTTWNYISELNTYTQGTEECGIEYLGNNRIIAVLRDANMVKTWQTYSDDMGLTWDSLTEIQDDIEASGRHRIYTRSHLKGYDNWWNDKVLIMVGVVFVTSGSSHPRRNAIWVSKDAGETWSETYYVDTQGYDGGYGDILYNKRDKNYIYTNYKGTSLLDTASVKQYTVKIEGI